MQLSGSKDLDLILNTGKKKTKNFFLNGIPSSRLITVRTQIRSQHHKRKVITHNPKCRNAVYNTDIICIKDFT